MGLAIALKCAEEGLDEVSVLESNKKILGENQSLRNSGVLHAGIYYDKKIAPLKAELCVRGNERLYQFSKQYHVSQRTAKLVVATNQREEEYLAEVDRAAAENKVPGIQRLDSHQIERLEPNVRGTAALYFPTSGIIDAVKLMNTLSRLATEKGVHIVTGNKIVDLKASPSKVSVTAIPEGGEKSAFETDVFINAAGLYADELARMVNPSSTYEIFPARGESAKFYTTRRPELAMKGLNVYPAPYMFDNATGEPLRVPLAEAQRLAREGRATRTVGMHLTPTFDLEGRISGTVTIGPAKTIGKGKEDYRTDLRPLEYFHRAVQPFFPGLLAGDVELHQAGIMASLKGHADWVIKADKKYPQVINLIGMDSPALTALFSIAEYVFEEHIQRWL